MQMDPSTYGFTLIGLLPNDFNWAFPLYNSFLSKDIPFIRIHESKLTCLILTQDLMTQDVSQHQTHIY